MLEVEQSSQPAWCHPATNWVPNTATEGGIERPLFEMVSASQTVIPNSEDAAAGQLGEGGLTFRPTTMMLALVRQHVEQCLSDGVEAALALAPGMLAASRQVLSEYGNMSGASIIFALDELRHRRDELAGGIGMMLGLGPGMSVEIMVLRAASGTVKNLHRLLEQKRASRS
ncbi:bisdemethoxycurcumin synthase-like [Phragmites australis]|uniref:bisdemethoxycurcumin synthase-like n=1 Tax=Phragmites australis TaxID=29695 RepID=UPI002D777BDC|nr:bisdemethoxycurcumin synthase-like [Phragmites australis]